MFFEFTFGLHNLQGQLNSSEALTTQQSKGRRTLNCYADKPHSCFCGILWSLKIKIILEKNVINKRKIKE